MHLIFQKINPFMLLYKIPSIKRSLAEQTGFEEPTDFLNDFWLNKQSGLSLWFVGGWQTGMTFLFFFGIITIVNKLLFPNLELDNWYWYFIIGGLSFVINYYYVFRNDKYLQYFDQFSDWTPNQKLNNIIFSLIIFVLAIGLFFMSLLYF